jgi:5'-nucleotidase
LRGRPLQPASPYRVTVNSFLAAGGDGFEVLKQGKDRKDGPLDIEALTAYLARASSKDRPLVSAGSPLRRIVGDACK